MFNDVKNQNVYNDKQIIMRIVLLLVFIMGPLTLSGCDNDFCGNSDNNTISISITGEEYFMVRSFWNNEVFFTKSSSFSLNQENNLVTPQCYVLQGWTLAEDNPLPRGAIKDIGFQEQCLIETVSLDGYISVELDNGTILTPSLIALARFEDPENLQNKGNGIYRSTEESGPPTYFTPDATASEIVVDTIE